jgi:hypothetical protein
MLLAQLHVVRLLVPTWYSDSGDDLQDSQPRKGFSPHSREGFVEELRYVWLSGAEGEELTAALASRRGGIDLLQPPVTQSEVFKLRVLRKKRKKRMK